MAKIVRSDGTISPDAEATAIRWAVDNGARVINMSFGGVRDPRDPASDTYSPLEAAAVRYAVSKGVLVVAAVGNADNAPTEPWGYAGYPAALPHVLGVSAIGRDGSVPNFSNRDRRYNDIAAPGEEIFSTLPRALTSNTKPGCSPQGYSDCGPPEFRRGEGTSFSAPLVAGAAAVLFGVASVGSGRPGRDRSHALGRGRGSRHGLRALLHVGRDALTGWGLLDVASAVRTLSDSPPDADRYEVNDEVVDRRVALGPQGPADPRDDRLLGRPRGRLQDQAPRPGSASSRGSAARAARTRISSSGSPGRQRIGGRVRRTGGCSPRSRSRPGSVERIRLTVTRERLVLPRRQGVDAAAPGRYALRYRKRAPRERRAALR